MSEQDGVQPSTKPRRSRKINTANQEIGNPTHAAQRPANNDTEAWKAYWKEQGQLWRTEPEIDVERQKYLADAELFRAHLQRVDFYKAHLEGAYLTDAHLEGASLRGAFFDAATTLTDIILSNEEFGCAFLSGTHWSEADLAVVNWTQVKK